jgi:hypothetical protein
VKKYFCAFDQADLTEASQNFGADSAFYPKKGSFLLLHQNPYVIIRTYEPTGKSFK